MGVVPDSVKVGLNLGPLQLSGEWRPDDAERTAAWEMYIELVTRIAVEELGPEEGTMREALSSLYSLFPTTRDVLRRYGPAVAQPKSGGEYSFGAIAVAVLNYALRPLLAKWHPRLQAHEALRDAAVGPQEHEKAWAEHDELRAALAEVREPLRAYADLLEQAADVSSLRTD